MRSKLTIKTPVIDVVRVFIVNFEHISHLVIVFFIVKLEHVIADWDKYIEQKFLPVIKKTTKTTVWPSKLLRLSSK